jgi:hypothetical protein
MLPRSSLARTRARSQLLVLCAIAIAGVWLGCATNGDPAVDEPAPAPGTTGTVKPDPTARPDFEAGFTDMDGGSEGGNNVDPTPPGGDTCVDNGDPGGAENTAKALPDTTDSQNTAISVSGVLNGAVDVDYYRLNVADTLGHLLQPDIQATSSGIEMCVFAKCPSGTSGVSCTAPAVAKKSDIGIDGCCATGPSSVTPSWNCGGTNDSAQLFIKITQTADKCVPYTFSYAF